MSDPVSLAGQAAAAQSPLLSGLGSVPEAGSPYDLDRLRQAVTELSRDLQPGGVQSGQAPPAPAVDSVSEAAIRSPGDSILEGIVHLKDNYHDSIGAINSRLNRLSSGDPMQLGSQFSETIALQFEVAQWSMSVMGVDNSTKAGTNAVKELSKGG